MLESHRLFALLARLKRVLLFRIDDPHQELEGDSLLALTEDVFFSNLYVRVPEIEANIVSKLVNYQMPVLLLGKQGIGKTSVLEQALRDVEEQIQVRVVRVRCTLRDRKAFSTADSTEAFLLDQLLFDLHRSDYDHYKLLLTLVERDPSYLRRTPSPAAKRLFTALSEEYADSDEQARSNMSLDDWIQFVLRTDHGRIRSILKQFKDEVDLGTMIDMIAIASSPQHRVLFAIDNVESLLDLDSIQNAVRLLVRFSNVMGEKGMLLVASRPRSYKMTVHNTLQAFPDAGANLYDDVDFSHFLTPIFMHDQESDQPSAVAEQHSRYTSRYWKLLLKRLQFLVDLSDTYTASEKQEVKAIFSGMQVLFDESPQSANLLAGLSNHSCRSYLVSVVNYVEQLVVDGRDLSLLGIDNASVLCSSSSVAKDTSIPGAMLSDVLHLTGSDGLEMPGVKRHRPKFLRAVELYRQTRQIPFECLAPFYICKHLDGCEVARFYEQEASSPMAPSVTVRQVVMHMKPFGFQGELVTSVLTALAMPDEWDQQVVDFASDPAFSVLDGLQQDNALQLESRGWLYANILPFKFHYWSADLAKSHEIRRSPGREIHEKQGIANVLGVIDAVLSFAEIELRIVQSGLQIGLSRNEALKGYGTLTHLSDPFIFPGILSRFGQHLERFHNYAEPIDASGDAFIKCIKELALGKQSMLGIVSRQVRERFIAAIEESPFSHLTLATEDCAGSWRSFRSKWLREARS